MLLTNKFILLVPSVIVSVFILAYTVTEFIVEPAAIEVESIV